MVQEHKNRQPQSLDELALPSVTKLSPKNVHISISVAKNLSRKNLLIDPRVFQSLTWSAGW